MRKLIETTFMTLNSAIDNPQNWSHPYWDDEHNSYNAQLMEGVDALVLGRVTYEGFAEAWSERAGDPFADKLNAMPKYVASRTLKEATWNSQILEGDVVEAVKRLKEEDGANLLKWGTGEFSKTLLEHKLVDEYHFWIFPVLAGGQRLFNGDDLAITHLDLLDSTTFKSGIVVHKLAPKP